MGEETVSGLRCAEEGGRTVCMHIIIVVMVNGKSKCTTGSLRPRAKGRPRIACVSLSIEM